MTAFFTTEKTIRRIEKYIRRIAMLALLDIFRDTTGSVLGGQNLHTLLSGLR
jgi:hypothetical protein